MLINQKATVRVEQVAGPHPMDRLLIVDNFYADPYQVREYALKRRFTVQPPTIRNESGFYPGPIAPLQRDWPGVDAALLRVQGVIQDGFAVEIPPSAMLTDFAVMNVPATELAPVLRHPNFDRRKPFLGLVYLNPFIDSGTSFYRNRRTGIHAVGSEGQMRFIVDFVNDPGNSAVGQGYILGSNCHWERIYVVAGKFNRFVAFPGHLLHSADVFLSTSKRLGDHRLTQRFLVLDAMNRGID